jgi:hypothetical protein
MNCLRRFFLRCRGSHWTSSLPAFSQSDIVRIRQAGFQMHVPKPVEPAQLILAIAELLRTSNTET